MASRRRAGWPPTRRRARIPVIAVTASAFGDTRQGGAGRRMRGLSAKARARRGVVRCAAEAPRPRVRVRTRPTAVRGRGRRSARRVGTPRSRGASCAKRPLSARSRDLQAIADTLTAGDEADAALGRRIGALAAEFRFRRRARARGLARSGWTAAMSTDAATVSLAPPSTILVVDDSPTNLQVLVRTLQGSGHRILAARGRRRPPSRSRSKAQPDLMLLDVMMPGMDGFEVLRASQVAAGDAPHRS